MEELVFKFLEKEDIDDIYDLTCEVYEGIENKEIFSQDSKEELEALIDGGGSFVGVFDGGKLIAYRSIKVPSHKDNLAHDVDFYIEPESVIVNDTVVVLKEYRGRNLQNITREKLEERYKNSKFTNKMSTISPKNYRSYKNTLDSGYMLVSLKKKYPDEFSEDGYDRFILLKSDDLDIKMTGKERIIHSSKTDELKKAFEDSYFGLAVDEDGYILFREVEIS